ncbi:MAG: GNAT family N-acetyltransferase [Rhodothermaceae bacterium]|nr:GNAT family N-acetyltransferase [Rhodothermaceae bacterium]MXX59241.1 GNAT family N-acetyltransferase [Rhodothermaceae bacterium]MYD20261.1 GNAT family N-acetyltransferase [Rhodothermaceae bacterium]MYD55668.1 GNAT family N-acetyltransferase [Rhodothermaceae bacterium]MYI42743.1 GNAT family N-acetyltransferase [Rhodothermaceae bacterium]
MNADIRIQRATFSELSGLSKLFDGYRRFYRMKSDISGAREFLAARLRHKDSIILVAWVGDESIVGFVQLYPAFSSVRMGPIWILNDLYVQRDWRGQGVGQRLMEEARVRAVQNGCIALELATEKTNTHAKRLYEKLGYSLDETFDHYELALT